MKHGTVVNKAGGEGGCRMPPAATLTMTSKAHPTHEGSSSETPVHMKHGTILFECVKAVH